MPSQEVVLDVAQGRLLDLLRTRGLSIKDLDESKKAELRVLLGYLHDTKGLSLNDIAKLIGNKTSGYTSWLCRQLGVRSRPFEEARLKAIREKRRKYERRPFDGTDEDRAYLLGLRHGDLSVSKPWRGVVRVSTSTTHPAMVQLFRTLFEPYGHVYQHPRYKKDTRTYEWNVQVNLDDSFSFLQMGFSEARSWVEGSETRVVAYLSGFLDAEGSIVITHSVRGKIVIFVDYFNEDQVLLTWIEDNLRRFNLGTSLRINKPIGRGTTGFRLNHNRLYWQLSAFSARNILGFIEELKLRHPEKLAKRDLALSIKGVSEYSEVFERVATLRGGIKYDVAEFVKLAEESYLKTHPSPVKSEGSP